MARVTRRPVCWICFVAGVVTRLDDESRCPMHGLVRDRVLGIVQVDTRILARRPWRD